MLEQTERLFVTGTESYFIWQIYLSNKQMLYLLPILIFISNLEGLAEVLYEKGLEPHIFE